MIAAPRISHRDSDSGGVREYGLIDGDDGGDDEQHARWSDARHRVGHPSRVPRGHRKTQGGQPQKLLPAALFVTEPTSQNSRVFSRACQKSPQRRRLTRRRRAKSAAQRDFGVFWALKGQNRTAARAR